MCHVTPVGHRDQWVDNQCRKPFPYLPWCLTASCTSSGDKVQLSHSPVSYPPRLCREALTVTSLLVSLAFLWNATAWIYTGTSAKHVPFSCSLWTLSLHHRISCCWLSPYLPDVTTSRKDRCGLMIGKRNVRLLSGERGSTFKQWGKKIFIRRVCWMGRPVGIVKQLSKIFISR